MNSIPIQFISCSSALPSSSFYRSINPTPERRWFPFLALYSTVLYCGVPPALTTPELFQSGNATREGWRIRFTSFQNGANTWLPRACFKFTWGVGIGFDPCLQPCFVCSRSESSRYPSRLSLCIAPLPFLARHTRRARSRASHRLGCLSLY